MSRGGFRPGSGRKPDSVKIGVVLGMETRRRVALPTALPLEVQVGLLEPPADLGEIQRECWRQWAPLAIAERTLTPATEAGFRELCSRMAIMQALDARLALLGIGTQDAVPYLRVRQGQSSLLGQSLKDFKLSAFGRPVTSDKPQAANPWAAISGSAAK